MRLFVAIAILMGLSRAAFAEPCKLDQPVYIGSNDLLSGSFFLDNLVFSTEPDFSAEHLPAGTRFNIEIFPAKEGSSVPVTFVGASVYSGDWIRGFGRTYLYFENHWEGGNTFLGGVYTYEAYEPYTSPNEKWWRNHVKIEVEDKYLVSFELTTEHQVYSSGNSGNTYIKDLQTLCLKSARSWSPY